MTNQHFPATLFVFFFLLATILSLPLAQGQSKSILEISDKFIGLDPNRLDDTMQKKSASQFWLTLRAIRDNDQNQKKVSGNATFGFDLNQTHKDELFNLNGGLTLSRGYYPGQFNFNSRIDLKVQNGNVQENVSDIFMSYDFFPLKGNQIWLENFIFMNRFKDEFIGIQQRYEIGGGVIFENWSKNKLLKEGKDAYEKVQVVTFDSKLQQTKWSECFEEACTFFKINNLEESDLDVLRKAQERTLNSLVTEYSKVRVGLLLGLYIESEQTKFSDSIQILESGSPILKFFSKEPKSTVKGRMGIRPFLVLNPGERWNISLKPYFKFSMPWAWEEKISSSNVEVFSEKTDYYIDVVSHIQVKIGDFQNKKVTLSLDYRLIYDNSPPRMYLNDQITPEGEIPLLSARNTHHITRLRFGLEF